jgi:nitroimidazol reductase NimA-like FMN-containing flavoprotein (pyridoxamine 5'-phosphate oxidase superfamily)
MCEIVRLIEDARNIWIYCWRHKVGRRTSQLETKLRELIRDRKLCSLSTHNKGQPYASLVAYAGTDDLKHIVFATPKATRKYANIKADSRAAVLITKAGNKVSDFRQAMAATAVGTVREIRKTKSSKLLKLYLGKHPHLTDFVQSPTCSVLCLDVRSFYVVDRFQHVLELHLKK